MLMEEVGEVARIMARQYGDQSFKKSDEAVDLADEMADVMFVLMLACLPIGFMQTIALFVCMCTKSTAPIVHCMIQLSCIIAMMSFLKERGPDDEQPVDETPAEEDPVGGDEDSTVFSWCYC